MQTDAPIRLGSDEKLLLLRQLDRDRDWESLDDRRFCLCCLTTFTGRQVDIIGGTRELGRLRLLCPTANCCSTPKDWIYPTEDMAVHRQAGVGGGRQPHVVSVVRTRARRNARNLGRSSAVASWRVANRRIADLFRTLRASAAAPP
jgi:hypothetical protein